MFFDGLSAIIKLLGTVTEKLGINDQDKLVFLHFPLKK